jgi:hypothetical protein
MGVMVSPLRGADGNVEFLAHLLAGAGNPPVDPSPAIEAVLATARAGGLSARAGGLTIDPAGRTAAGIEAPEE